MVNIVSMSSDDDEEGAAPSLPLIGTKIDILWSSENKYYTGNITKYTRTSLAIINYEKKEEETV